MILEIKELEIHNREIQDKIKYFQKNSDEKQQGKNLLIKENDNLREQLNNIQVQYKKLMNENEDLRGQVFEQKQILLDYDKRETNNSMTIEKLEIYFNQAREMLNKAEKNIEVCDTVIINIFVFRMRNELTPI